MHPSEITKFSSVIRFLVLEGENNSYKFWIHFQLSPFLPSKITTSFLFCNMAYSLLLKVEHHLSPVTLFVQGDLIYCSQLVRDISSETLQWRSTSSYGFEPCCPGFLPYSLSSFQATYNLLPQTPFKTHSMMTVMMMMMMMIKILLVMLMMIWTATDFPP